MTNTKKSVYQLPTFYDMFINFKGSQGTGKDTIASLLTHSIADCCDKYEIEGPLYGYTAEMNFEDMFKDQFFVFGSTNYVLIISEPGGKEQASLNGAQMNQFKNIRNVENLQIVYFSRNNTKGYLKFSLCSSLATNTFMLLPQIKQGNAECGNMR